MGRKKTTDEQKKAATNRSTEFRYLSRYFYSVSEFAEWVASITGVSKGTVLIWRCKKDSGYAIPVSHFQAVLKAAKKDPRFKVSID